MNATALRTRRLVLTGATGTVASLVTRRLEPAGHRITLVSRALPACGARAGFRHMACDYEDLPGLVTAFRGADAVLVVTNDPLRPGHDRNILRAAEEASVGHLVKLSAAAVRDPGAEDLITSWQRANEEAIVKSGIPWTMVQPRSFMTHALSWAAGIRSSGTTRALHPESRNACVAPEDIADVCALVLGDPAHHYRSYELTGPQALSARDQTAVLACLLQRPLTCLARSPQEARAVLLDRYPPAVADALEAGARRQAAGAKSRVTDTVARLTGRAPTTFTQWATAHLHHFV
ncbi:NAD(P)H-binding protein [Streptomyces chilikensis]|uniref:NAD(P)H-binding protein n=1 Tax=Streptomyces chilikensis TaxID=1194079 RepID=UPI000B0349F6|nr:NAD(P)H-binding protein [Streptomyces chilikensis]